MRYTSQVTPKGNSSYSYMSQADADARAAALDEANCSRCSRCLNCSDCSNCSHCSRCLDCSDCLDCSRCSHCSRCSRCSRCSNCSHCSRCSDCSRCSNCSHCSRCSDCSRCLDCSGEIIQAGRPNGYQCYGWLKDGALFIHCGCHRKTFSEAIEYWFNKPDRAEILLACHYIADIARLKGWTV